ncbi:MAG: histidine--tRNA ligase [Trueperaceae bacterium]|nr:histidine--tRNA ligase [Trueperaceae bacterium]
MRPQAPKGTYDVLPDDQPRWRHLTDTVRRVLGRAGAQELTTPIIEHAEVFEKAVGDAADLVVQKEMYTFEDRGGRRLTLRPELTAGVLRAFIERGMHTWPSPVKLWSAGPAFRAENVQRGRYRQFHQVNLEIVGADGALADAEAIALMADLLRELGLRTTVLKVGSVGDPDDRARYNAYLRDALAPHEARLSPASRERLRLNPMRVLDSKDDGDQALVAPLQRPLDLLGDDARAHFDAVLSHLRDWGIDVDVDPAIVRGLDYYRRTAFEVHYTGIGAQSALGGGGRYDGLVRQLGGPDVPGIGWALGVERLFDALAEEGVTLPERGRPLVYLVALDEIAVGEMADLARRLRGEFHVEHGYVKRNPTKGLRDADRSGATYAVLRGDRERRADGVVVKHLASGDQVDVATELLADRLRPAHTTQNAAIR